MKMKINDNRKISAIQEEFNSAFPYLKLEFFDSPHSSGAPSAKASIRKSNQTLGECRRIHTSGEFEIDAQMTVSDLEQGFINVYGLSVQVFRKSGKVWLETTVTDGWTLLEQNKQGEELSRIAS